jgi:hypothetical protein
MANEITYTDSEILDIAKRQKAILWLIVASIPAYALNLVIRLVPTLVIGIISLVFIYKLAVALKSSVPWVWVISGVIPCVGLIALLILNSYASAALRARGIKVGLMGASTEDLAKLTGAP